MDALSVTSAVKSKFAQIGSLARVPLLSGGSFTAELREEGVLVDNLGSQPFLPWAVFQEAIRVLIWNGGKAMRGDAKGSKLGEPGLPTDSVEGHIARVVYGKRSGDSVFRRITPIACILVWAGVCEPAPGALVLSDLT